MRTITIYTTRTSQHYEFGPHICPAKHTLNEPLGISRTWITRAEYALPDGYTVHPSNNGTDEIYNAAGGHCPLGDSVHHGKSSGQPVMFDLIAPQQFMRLAKLRDLPW